MSFQVGDEVIYERCHHSHNWYLKERVGQVGVIDTDYGDGRYRVRFNTGWRKPVVFVIKARWLKRNAP